VLDILSEAELVRVRDYERRNKNREHSSSRSSVVLAAYVYMYSDNRCETGKIYHRRKVRLWRARR
jgi:hypothetical protein